MNLQFSENQQELIEAVNLIDDVILVVRKEDFKITAASYPACERLFGLNLNNALFNEVKWPLNENNYTALNLGLQQIFDNILPVDLAISMLPNQLPLTNGNIVQVKFKPIVDADDKPFKLIITFSNVTDAKDSEKKMEVELNRLKAVVQVMQQREIFLSFLQETAKTITSLNTSKDYTESKRILHTIKGNSAAFSLMELSSSVHSFEQEIVSKMQEVLSNNKTYSKHIVDYLKEFVNSNSDIFGIKVEYNNQEEMLVTSKNISNSEALEEECNSNSSLPALAAQYKQTIEKLSIRLSKKINFNTEGLELEFNKNIVLPVVNHLIHVLRNSIDHGLEKPEERIASGKPEVGNIWLKFKSLEDNSVLIEVRDDGRGINTKGILEKSVKNGVITSEKAQTLSQTEIYDLMFIDGVSTAERVTSISGRGVGLSALLAEVNKYNGKITIDSVENKGSYIQIIIPNAALNTNNPTIENNSNNISVHTKESDTKNIETDNPIKKCFINWSHTFSVGYSEIDEEHQQLVDILNNVASIQGDEKIGDLNEALILLVTYTQKHFATEEKLMMKHNYPSKDKHFNEHRELLRGVESYIERLDLDKTKGITAELLNFLKAWLLSHIISSDVALGKFMQKVLENNPENLSDNNNTIEQVKQFPKTENVKQDYLPWNKSFSIGIDMIDEQHKELVDILNRVAELKGDDSKVGEIQETLNKLVKYTMNHFSYEEGLMHKYKYPNADKHISYHKDLLKTVEGYVERLDKEKTSGITEEILNFLKAWLLAHIVSSDMSLGKHIQNSEYTQNKLLKVS